MESNEAENQAQPPQQQLHGVVIITLPPIDNPSKGKTITAFSLTDDDIHQHQQNLTQNSPIHSPQSQQQNPSPHPRHHASISPPNLFQGTPRKLLTLLGISLFALILYNFATSSITLQQLMRVSSSNDADKKKKEDKPTSILLPLYHKLSIQEMSQRDDFEIKFGRFLDLEKEKIVSLPINDDKGVNFVQKKVNHPNLVFTNAASTDSSTVFPVKGNVFPDGFYFTVMLIGSPQRRYFLDVDTGSDLTWIQCDAPCTSCAKGANPLYKPRHSNIVPSGDSLCKEVQKDQKGYCEACQQCDYEIGYADQSSSMGVLARDNLYLKVSNGSSTKLNAVFGCAYDQQGSLLNTLAKTDGILGLSRAKVGLPSQLAKQGIINNVVGHCLTTDTVGGGYMFLGDEYVPQWGMTWVPMLNDPSINFYHAKIVKMSYGRSHLSLGGRDSKVVFDTGSSYTYFPKEAYDELVASLKEVSGEELIQDPSDSILPVCWKAQFPIRSILDVKQHFKSLTLNLANKWWIGSTKVQIPPEGYLTVSKNGNVCLGILDGTKVHDGHTIILGDISLRGQLIVYDNVNHRIGWAQSDCIQPNRFESSPFFEG